MNRAIICGFIGALIFLSPARSSASVDIDTAGGKINADFTLFNISGYPVSFRYNPELKSGPAGASWESSLNASLEIPGDVPIYTVNAYSSKFMFIRDEQGKFESGGGLGGKFELINGDYTLTSNAGEKLTFDEKGNLKTIQDETGSLSIISRDQKKLISGWETRSGAIKNFSIDSALEGAANTSSASSASLEWMPDGTVSAIKAQKAFKFNYKDSKLSSITVNNNEAYLFTYNKKGLLRRLKEPGHDYNFSYYKDGRVKSIDDRFGESLYVEYQSDTEASKDVRHVYVWNLTRFIKTHYKYMKDTVEIQEGTIDSDDVLFGSIDRKTNVRKARSIAGDTMEVKPGKDGRLSVSTMTRGFSPYKMEVDFGNTLMRNINGIEYFKDIIYAGGMESDKISSDIKNDGIIRDGNKNVTGLFVNGIETKRYNWSEDGSDIERSISSTGNQTLFKYDDHGRIVQKEDSIGNKTSYRYRDGGFDVVYPNGTTSSIATNDKNMPVTIADPLGRVTRFGYGNPVIPNFVELSGFDSQSFIQSIEDGIYFYDSTLFGSWFFIEKDDGSVTRVGPDENVTNYFYDRNKLLLSVSDADGKVISSYTYNKYLQLSKASSEGCILSFGYDDYGRMLQKSYNKELSINIAYNGIDLSQEISDSSGFHLRYGRNQGGAITSINLGNGVAFSVAYYDSGLIKEIKYPNGITASWNYDLLGRISQYTINFPDGSSRVSVLKYDKAGNLVESETDGKTVDCSYDELGHLTGVSDSKGKSVRLKFDVWGNLLQLGSKESKGDSPGCQTEINSVALSYTKDSSIREFTLDEKKSEISYDRDNRINLISSGPDKLTISYAPLDEQIYQLDTGSRQKKYYFLYDRLYATWDSESKHFTRYVYLPGSNICLAVVRHGGKVDYALNDIFGSITDLADSKGNLTGSRTFNTLGAVKSSLPMDLDMYYGGMIGLDGGNIIFAEKGPVLLKIMRYFSSHAQLPGNILLDHNNKLSFMEEMPLTNFNELRNFQNTGVNSRQL